MAESSGNSPFEQTGWQIDPIYIEWNTHLMWTNVSGDTVPPSASLDPEAAQPDDFTPPVNLQPTATADPAQPDTSASGQ